MKLRLLLTIFAIVLGTLGVSYASFPVQTAQETSETVVSEDSNEDLSSPAAADSTKNKWIALGLAAVLFLTGIGGLHRFYMGQIGIGVAQLLTFGGCGIWAIIDIIRILTDDLQPKGGTWKN